MASPPPQEALIPRRAAGRRDVTVGNGQVGGTALTYPSAVLVYASPENSPRSADKENTSPNEIENGSALCTPASAVQPKRLAPVLSQISCAPSFDLTTGRKRMQTQDPAAATPSHNKMSRRQEKSGTEQQQQESSMQQEAEEAAEELTATSFEQVVALLLGSMRGRHTTTRNTTCNTK